MEYYPLAGGVFKAMVFGSDDAFCLSKRMKTPFITQFSHVYPAVPAAIGEIVVRYGRGGPVQFLLSQTMTNVSSESGTRQAEWRFEWMQRFPALPLLSGFDARRQWRFFPGNPLRGNRDDRIKRSGQPLSTRSPLDSVISRSFLFRGNSDLGASISFQGCAWIAARRRNPCVMANPRLTRVMTCVPIKRTHGRRGLYSLENGIQEVYQKFFATPTWTYNKSLHASAGSSSSRFNRLLLMALFFTNSCGTGYGRIGCGARRRAGARKPAIQGLGAWWSELLFKKDSIPCAAGLGMIKCFAAFLPLSTIGAQG
jgi:hypothetical protein